MKSLNELIEAVQDVEARANEYYMKVVDREFVAAPSDAFKAGARSQARLGEALKIALERVPLEDDDFETRKRIRATLEKAASE